MNEISMRQQWEWHKKWYQERAGKNRITIEGVPSCKIKNKKCPYCHRKEMYRNEYTEGMCIYCGDGNYMDFVKGKDMID